MKVGDIVKHNTYGYIALVVRMPRSTSDAGMMTVETMGWGMGRWRVSNCEVISESR